MAASKTIGGINVTISATTDRFTKGLTTARQKLVTFVKSVKGAIFSLKGLTAALTGVAFVKFTANQFEAIAALGDLSDTLGISTEKLAGYQHAASEAGISNTVLEKSLATLRSKGLSLEGWVEQTAKLSTHQARLNATIELFGARGRDMVRLVGGGTQGLRDAQKAAESLGLALDRKTVAGVDRAGEAFARFKTAVSGIFRSLAAEISPFVEVLSNKATDFLATNGRGNGMGKSIADFIIKTVGFIGDMIQNMVRQIGELVREIRNWIRNKPLLQMGIGPDDRQFKKRTLKGPLPKGGAVSQPVAFSTWLNGMMEDARKAATEQAKNNPAARGSLGGLFNRAGSALSPGVTSAAQIGESLWKGFARGVQATPGLMLKGWWAANQFQANNWKAGGASQSFRGLAAQDPLSREGNAQRVRSLVQNEGMKIGKQQLAKQGKIEGHTKRIADAVKNWNFQPANL